MTWNNFLNYRTKDVALAALILAVAGLASRLLGFLRNALLAYFFGAGDVLDAYFLAFRLPDFFFNLLFFGALSAGFVPVFIKLKSQNTESAWRLANDVLNITLVIFSAFGLLFFALAPWILKFIAPGFDHEKLSLAVMLARIMFLQPIFLGVSGIFSGVLQSSHKFLSYALAPVFYNLGIIFGILVLTPAIGLAGLAWGVVVGALLHMLVQYPAARASGFSYRPIFSLKEGGLRRILSIMVPRSLSLILVQLNLVVMAAVASFLGSGRVAVFNFANDLNGLVLGVVAVPLGVAVFPILAAAATKKNIAEFSLTLKRILRQLAFIMIPAAVLLFVLRAQVVRLTLGYGSFDWEDTVLTIHTLGFFLVGLVFQGFLIIALRGFFALEDAKTPFWVLLGGILISVALSLLLAPVLDVPALAIAMSAGAVFNATVLAVSLGRKIGGLGLGALARPVSRFIAAALAAGFSTYGLLYFFDIFFNTHRVAGLLLQTALAGLAGVLVYLLAGYLGGIEEVRTLKLKLSGLGQKVTLPSQIDEEIR